MSFGWWAGNESMGYDYTNTPAEQKQKYVIHPGQQPKPGFSYPSLFDSKLMIQTTWKKQHDAF